MVAHSRIATYKLVALGYQEMKFLFCFYEAFTSLVMFQEQHLQRSKKITRPVNSFSTRQ